MKIMCWGLSGHSVVIKDHVCRSWCGDEDNVLSLSGHVVIPIMCWGLSGLAAGNGVVIQIMCWVYQDLQRVMV